MVQTQNVTVLFTDLVGSTELSSSLSPEAADEVRRAHFSALRDAIATTGGSEVKNLGDGLMVGFDATAPALSCAVAMQQGIDRHNRKSPVPLAVRIGISTGDVTVEDGDYFGDPVIEAARLCAVAQGGQILATEAVKILARRSGHSFITERELELKGLPEPVVAWEVVWEPVETEEAGTSGIALPPRLPPAPAIGVVGRKAELERLKDALKAITTGEPARVVLVSGEAGLGKSTLVSSLARDAHQEGVGVLYGRCDDDLAVPHRPFAEALSHYIVHAEDRDLSTLGDERLSALVPLVPELRMRRPELAPTATSDPDAERWMLYGAVVGLLEHASCDAPLVLILDDLHWADRPTLQLLRHVASQRPGRILVLGTYRETDLSVSHPLSDTLAALTREPSVSRMSLSGLEDDEVICFVEAAAGQALDEAGVGLAHALYRETDGNPFFMAEVLRHLVETRSIVQDDAGRWVPTQELEEAGLPDSVRQVIGARVARLGEESTRILSAASVLGQEFEVDLLAAIVGSDEDSVLDLLEAAASAAVVGEVRATQGRYRFLHALIQHTLYDDLGPNRRARFHRAAAEELERRLGEDPGARAGELARHWLTATRPTESSKAVTYACLAGENALSCLAPPEAIRWFNEALGVLENAPDDKERSRCLARLGEAQRQAGDPAFRETLLEAAHIAKTVGDTDTLVEAALANNRGFFSSLGVVDAERVEVLEAALEALPDTDSPLRARLLARLCNELAFGSLERRLELAREAKAVALRVGDDETLGRVLVDLASNTLRIPALLEDSLENSREAVRIADSLDDPFVSCVASIAAAIDATRAGEFNFAREQCAELTEMAQRLRQPAWLWIAAFQAAGEALLHGDPSRAEVLAHTALEIGTASGQPDAFSFYGTQLVEIRNQQGRKGELAGLIAQLAEEHPGIPTYRAVLASSYMEAGNDTLARQLVEDAAAQSFDMPMDVAWMDGVLNYAQSVIGLRMMPAAEQLFELLRPYHGQVPYQGLLPREPVAMYLGALLAVLGRFQDAEAYFEEATELNRRGDMRYAEAQTQMLWGRMLSQRGRPGDTERARILLEEARKSAVARGYTLVEQQATTELSRLW